MSFGNGFVVKQFFGDCLDFYCTMVATEKQPSEFEDQRIDLIRINLNGNLGAKRSYPAIWHGDS